jgi:hypothetical protein
MPLNRGTQKEIAKRFMENLGYFRQAHYWRRIRFLTIFVLSVAGTAAMAWFYFRGPEKMYNPGPVSKHHLYFTNGCAECHKVPSKSLAGATLKFTNVGIDDECRRCHTQHSFHHPSVGEARSCTACHQEHKSNAPMAAVADSQCTHCHKDHEKMKSAAIKGKPLAAALLNFRPDLGWKVFKTPDRSYEFTNFTHFATNHPEFRVADTNRPSANENLPPRDKNTLMFNHYRHLVDDDGIPEFEPGRRLKCEICHEPAAGGAFMRPISYERHCQRCHDLLFDPKFDTNYPNLRVPHGRADHARAFLRSLPLEYADIAQKQGHTGETAIRNFVAEQMQRLQGEFTNGYQLEHLVLLTGRNNPDRMKFLTRNRMEPGDRSQSARRAQFDGCATCHEVTEKPFEAPIVTPPWTPDRWMARAHFDHSKHRVFNGKQLECTQCHGGATNQFTAEYTANILMPSIKTCIPCHSPTDPKATNKETINTVTKAKAVSDCATCHTYHTKTNAVPPLSKAL